MYLYIFTQDKYTYIYLPKIHRSEGKKTWPILIKLYVYLSKCAMQIRRGIYNVCCQLVKYFIYYILKHKKASPMHVTLQCVWYIVDRSRKSKYCALIFGLEKKMWKEIKICHIFCSKMLLVYLMFTSFLSEMKQVNISMM